jgi:hypothetical protein
VRGLHQGVLRHLSKSYQESWMAINGDHNTGELLTLATSSASVEEQATSALKDGKSLMGLLLWLWSDESGELK